MVSRMLIKTLGAVAVIATSVSFAGSVSAAPAPRRIEVTAKKFSYAPAEITVKKGEAVVLVLHSEDVPHGLKFKELNLQTDIGKGASSELAFTADKAGDFIGHCSHFCGSGHGSMALTLHVTE
jgi:cytochrome c oxidase subunit 2